MSYSEEHLARMNRSGQRGGAVGSKPTVVTQKLLNLESTEAERRNALVLDFGAGKRATQTAILRDYGFCDVTPYDIGANFHETVRPETGIYDYVLLSNVVNVQENWRQVEEVLEAAWNCVGPWGRMIVNLPNTPRYGKQTRQGVLDCLLLLPEVEVVKEEKYGSGTLWIVEKF